MTPTDERRRNSTRVALAVTAAVLVALLVALTIGVQAGWDWVHDVDSGTANGLNRYINDHRGQINVWKAITDVGQPTVFRIAAIVAGVVLWLRRRRSAAVFVVVAVEATSLLSTLGKVSIDRSRPHVAHPVSAVPTGLSAGSYPSGHALTSAAAAGAAVVLLWPVLSRLGRAVSIVLGALVAGLIGFSRLILGVHFVTDVLAAWLLGALWTIVVGGVFLGRSRLTLPTPGHRIRFRT